MFRLTFGRMSVIALMLVGVIMAAVGSQVFAQDATPAAGPIATVDLAPGVTANVMAASPSLNAPEKTVYIATFDFKPGMAIFPHSHPGTTVLAVQSGSLGWTLAEGTAHVVRGAASGNPSAVEDLTQPGADVVLEPGDAIYYERDVVHTARGAGDTDAIVLGTLVLDVGAPLLMPAGMDMSTPTS